MLQMKMLMDFVLHRPVNMYFRCRDVVAVGDMQMLRVVVGPRHVPRSLMSLTTELFQVLDERLSVLLLLPRQPRVGVEIVVVESHSLLRLVWW